MANKTAKKVQKKVVRKTVAKKAPVRIENIDLITYFKTGKKEHQDNWSFIEGNVMSVITNHPKQDDSVPIAVKVD